jgi:hypothetical protein
MHNIRCQKVAKKYLWEKTHKKHIVNNIEELVPVRVMIRIVEILLYLIFQSPKPVSWASKTVSLSDKYGLQ